MRGATGSIRERVLQHLLGRVECATAESEPFGHFYLEDVLPWDIYERLLDSLPEPDKYIRASERYQAGEANFVRTFFNLDAKNMDRLDMPRRHLWEGIASALMASELKEGVFAKLAPDLIFRYGCRPEEVRNLPGFAMPALYRETEGFEIPPHPDTRKKVVTMHLYFPRDRSQLELGTALYKRKILAWPFGGWRNRFTKVKQFAFAPNSGYAFVVNNAITKKSWHGREQLPPGAGVRNTLLMTFYEKPKNGFQLPDWSAAKAA